MSTTFNQMGLGLEVKGRGSDKAKCNVRKSEKKEVDQKPNRL